MKDVLHLLFSSGSYHEVITAFIWWIAEGGLLILAFHYHRFITIICIERTRCNLRRWIHLLFALSGVIFIDILIILDYNVSTV